MRRFLPVMVLIVLAPLVAEVLAGSTPLTMPALLLSDLLIYGPGALLIRELVRRRGRGWVSVLLLGIAYGLIEEGLALQSLFNPAYGHVAQWGARLLGVNWLYTEVVLITHAVWSAAIPILLTELLFPAQRTTPYLRRFGLIVTGIWYILGAALLGLFARTTYPYAASPLLLGLVLVLVIVLVLIALRVLPRQSPRPTFPINVPPPWVVLLVTTVGVFIGLAGPALLWRVQSAFADFPLVLIPLVGTLLVTVVMLWLVRNWARGHSWSDRHRLALVTGALLAHSVVGGLIFTKTLAEGVSIAVMTLLMLGLLALFASRMKGRVASRTE